MIIARPQTVLGLVPASILRRFATPTLSSVCLRLLSDRARVVFWNQIGCALSPDCYIGPLVSIVAGRQVVIGRGSALSGRIELAAWGSITIGRNVMVNHDVHFLTGSHDLNDPEFSGAISSIVIEDNVWIAQGAVILPGVTIGEGAVVGAYAVVPSDVLPRTVVVGNPARVVSKREVFQPAFIPAEFLLSRARRRSRW